GSAGDARRGAHAYRQSDLAAAQAAAESRADAAAFRSAGVLAVTAILLDADGRRAERAAVVGARTASRDAARAAELHPAAAGWCGDAVSGTAGLHSAARLGAAADGGRHAGRDAGRLGARARRARPGAGPAEPHRARRASA